jgi:predicted TPR repeat methyltransferase
MIRSFNCEIQAYGVAGLSMLSKRGCVIPNDIKNLVQHIKKRNSDLVVCLGCSAGLVSKIYAKK